MAINVGMPKLGMTMEAGKIVEWRKKDGEKVDAGEVILVIETEKVSYDVESPGTGILHIIVAEEEEVPVGELIGMIAADEAEYEMISKDKAVAAAGIGGGVAEADAASPAGSDQGVHAVFVGEEVERVRMSPRARRIAKERGVDTSFISGSGAGGRITEEDVLNYGKVQVGETASGDVAVHGRSPGERVRSTPVAEKMAKKNGIDISLVPGSGVGGRITPDDVLRFQEAKSADAAGKGRIEEVPGSIPKVIRPAGEERVIKRTGMRKIVAQKMLESTTEVAAQTYMSNSVDAHGIQEYRLQLLPYAEKKANVRVTITDILMKITAFALKEHPIINSRYSEEGDVLMSDVHMGMAMALPEGLIVPVIWNVDEKSIIEIARDRLSLIERGRSGNLTPDDMKGSTFTLSALGMYGIEEFAAIINQPENAILAVAAILKKPWVVNDLIMIRPIMNMKLTYDHRTIYGVDAAEFMATLKLFMENPLMVLA